MDDEYEAVTRACSECDAIPYAVADGPDGVGLQCDCPTVGLVHLDLERTGLFDTTSGHWRDCTDDRTVCAICEARVRLARHPIDGYRLTCDCPEWGLETGPIDDMGLLNPLGGRWATLDDP